MAQTKTKPKSDPEPINPIRRGPQASSPQWPEDLANNLRALTRFTLVQTEEEHLLLETLSRMMPRVQDRTWVFNAEYGLEPIRTYLQLFEGEPHKDPHCQEWPAFRCPALTRFERIQKFYSPADSLETMHTAMHEIVSSDPRHLEFFYLILDPEMWFGDRLMVRKLINLATHLQADQDTVKCLLFVGHPSTVIPPALSKFISPVAYGLQEDTVGKRLEESVLESLTSFGVEIPSVDFGGLFSGLTCYEAEELILQSVTRCLPQGGPRRTLDLKKLRELTDARRKLRQAQDSC